MIHPDHETRVVAHRIFSVIVVPTSGFPRPCLSVSDTKALDVPRTLSRAVSVFHSSASLFEKLRQEKRSSSERLSQHNKESIAGGALSSMNSPPPLTKGDKITADNDNQNLVSLALMSIDCRFDCGPSVLSVFNLLEA